MVGCEVAWMTGRVMSEGGGGEGMTRGVSSSSGVLSGERPTMTPDICSHGVSSGIRIFLLSPP